MNQLKERRKYERFEAHDGAFAAISPNSYKLGQIINISRGGLAFQYIDTKNRISDNNEESHIFLSSKDHYVRGIPFKPVSDRPLPNNNPFSTLKMRQCSIQFEDLDMEQLINLDNYILNNTNKYAHS